MRSMLFVMIVPLAACSAYADGVPARGSDTSRSFAVAGFTRVEAAGSDTVDVRTGQDFSVRADGPKAVLDQLLIERRGDALHIGRKRGTHWNWGGHDGARIQVTMPRIDAASLAGSGEMRIDAVRGDHFAGAAAGSGSMKIGTLGVKSSRFEVAGSGEVHASGTSDRLDLSVAGSGDVDLSGVKAREANVEVAGSGSVRADIDGPAKVSVVGSGDVVLGDHARCTTSKFGSGTVRCGK